MEKAALRQAAAARTAALDEAARRVGDRAMAERVLTLPAWRAAKTVFIYVSVGAEPDTRGLIRAALAAGKRVSVPRCRGKGIMEARLIGGFRELLPAPFGLLEPGEDAPLITPGQIDLAIVPCVAADRLGNRLGHGGGYYDRYLARVSCRTVCLCWAVNVLDALPAEAHDRPVDVVITEGGAFSARTNELPGGNSV